MRGKLVALALAIMAIPVAAAQPLSATSAVQGHTVFAHLDPGGSDFAAIAGSVRCQVMWFNNQVLFQVDAGTSGMCGDAQYVYAFSSGAPDPRGNPTLEPTGRVFDFSDPNGASWHVVELRYQQLDVSLNQQLGLPDVVAEETGTDHASLYTWVVEAGPRIWDPTLQDTYNFVVLVDTGKVLVTEPEGAGGALGSGAPSASGARGLQTTDHAQSTPDSQHSYVTLALGPQPPSWE